MPNTFTITRTYDRDQIMEDARKVINMGGNVLKARNFLDQMYEGWSFDTRTSIMVELLCRSSSGDVLYPIFQERLAALNMKEAKEAA